MSVNSNYNSFQDYVNSMSKPLTGSVQVPATPAIPQANMAQLMQALNNSRVQQQPEQDKSNLLVNFARNVGDIGTGLVNLVTNPEQTAESLGNLAGMGADAAPVVWDMMLGNYNLGVKDIGDILTGKKSIGQGIADVGKGVYEHPADAALDFFSFGGGKLIKTATKGTKFSKALRAGEVVEGALASNNAKVARKAQVVADKAKELEKVSKGISKESLAEAVEAFETGKEITKPELKPVLKNLKAYMDEYDDLVKNYSPETWESGNKIATIQRGVRSGLGNYSEVEKKLLTYYDNPEFFSKGVVGVTEDADKISKTAIGNKLTKAEKAEIIAEKERILTEEGRIKLQELADKGDDWARFILESEDLHRAGWLKPVTHGAAEVEKFGEIADDITRAGRFSERAYGTAKYADIAEQLLRPHEWLDKQVANMVERQLANEILEKGTLGGEKLADIGSKDTRFVPREVIEKGDFRGIDKIAKEAPSSQTDIPISKYLLSELDNQSVIFRGSNPFKEGLLADLHRLGKSATLASGAYLSGNLQTGIANMLLNAGLNPAGLVQDIASAIQSRNRLSKTLGIYRNYERAGNTIKTQGLKQVDKIVNKPIGNVWNAIDAASQNFFAETAAHTNLRRKGIPFSEREKAILNMADNKVAEVVHDVKNVALLHPTRTLLPKQLHGAAGLLNPFWRWTDTALQASGYMMQKSPILSNIVLVDILSNVGLNQELANRMGLNVKSDKPFVSYRYNPRTKKVQEVSAEFVPLMNSLRFGGNLTMAISGKGKGEQIEDLFGSSIPVVSTILNSFQGKDRYGKPILRSHEGLQDAVAIQNGKRYKKNEFNQWVLDDSFHPDEPISAITREVLAPVNLYNKTVAPAVAGLASMISGQEQYYNRPYGNAIVGDYNVNPYNNQTRPFFAGNPARSAGGAEFIDVLKGLYTQEYYPENNFITPAFAKQLQRNAGRREFNNYLKSIGGQL